MSAELARAYLDEAIASLCRMRDEQLGQLRTAGQLLADAWERGGCLIIPRTGHSLHSELIGRAGGPVAVLALDDGGSSYDEQVAAVPAVRSGDLVLVHANHVRARKALSILELARPLGVTVIALVQTAYDNSDLVAKEFRNRPTVRDLADCIVDLGGVVGDAALAVPGSDQRMCPTSGVSGVAAAWAIVAQATGVLADRGRPPDFLRSVFLTGALHHNQQVRDAWRARRG